MKGLFLWIGRAAARGGMLALLLVALSTAAAMVAPTTARAQVPIDLATYTCSDFTRQSVSEERVVAGWAVVYAIAQVQYGRDPGNLVLNPPLLAELVRLVGARCQEAANASLPVVRLIEIVWTP